jgi:CrcB protein
MEPVILAGIGGALGAVFRYGCSRLPQVRGIPAGTLFVNVTGSFLFGLLVFLPVSPDLYDLVGTGAMGGFTTFSTFSFETFRMIENQDYYTMLANILTNGAGSILGAAAAFLVCTAFCGV